VSAKGGYTFKKLKRGQAARSPLQKLNDTILTPYYGMIIVSLFKLNNNESSGIFTITTEEIICCPLCNGELFYRDSKLRKLKDILGEVLRLFVRRLRCQVCKKLHTELPSIIQPYKHYDSNAIQSVLDGSVDASACSADNSTIRRWKAEFTEAEPDIAQRLASVYAQMTDEKVPIGRTSKILNVIKAKYKNWLAFVMKLLINSGQKLCTRFAFCPRPTIVKVCGIDKNATEGGKKSDTTNKNTS
jgi:uncharacterized protein YbaR (Trm112 family)